jgi:hypothetical protein
VARGTLPVDSVLEPAQRRKVVVSGDRHSPL